MGIVETLRMLPPASTRGTAAGFSSNRSGGCVESSLQGRLSRLRRAARLNRICDRLAEHARRLRHSGAKARCCIHESKNGFSTPIVTWSSTISIEARRPGTSGRTSAFQQAL